MNAGSGRPSPMRLAVWHYDRGFLCLKTSPGCSPSTGGQPYPRSSDRWPAWGTWDATGFTALPKPEPLISASGGSSLLLTPTANLASNGGSQTPEKRKAGGHGPTLADQIEQHLFPTPRASDGPHGSPLQTGTGLVPVITKLFPTPTAFDGQFDEINISPEALERQLHRTDGIRRNTTGNLTKDLILLHGHLFPTPNASDYKGSGQRPGRIRNGRLRPPGDADLPTAVEILFPTPAARDSKGPSLRGPGTIRSDTGRPRTAQQTDLPSAVLDLTGRNTSRPSADGK